MSKTGLAHCSLLIAECLVPLPPWVYWNVGVSAILRFDLWAATSYGQNLEPEGLSCGLGDLDFLDHGHSMEKMKPSSHGHVNIGRQKVCGKVEKVVENEG